jgi:hypothetical protein
MRLDKDKGFFAFLFIGVSLYSVRRIYRFILGRKTIYNQDPRGYQIITEHEYNTDYSSPEQTNGILLG